MGEQLGIKVETTKMVYEFSTEREGKLLIPPQGN
jgi:hypothetical protein